MENLIVEQVLSSFDCIITMNSATYISVPITSGKRFVDWYLKEGRHLSSDSIEYKSAQTKQVINPNIKEAQLFIDSIRKKYPSVIEPTKLNIVSWSQSDYHLFWQTVIERYVTQTFFLDGWHYSTGCIIEFYVSMKKGINTYCQDYTSVTIDRGMDLIALAIKEYKDLGFDSYKNAHIYTELCAFHHRQTLSI
jgi:hypothetical protein